ncbi:MAG: endolytic transglycosylase MltG, partial [Bacteroidota bacterium]
MCAAKKRKGKKNFNWLRGALVISICCVLLAAFKVFGPNTGSFAHDECLYIHTGATYRDVKITLRSRGFVNDMLSFDLLAKPARLADRIHPGKYTITPGMSNFSIIRMLRSGRQTPVKLVINKLRTKQDFIRLVSTNLEADSQSLKHLLTDNAYLSIFALDTNTVMCSIMPDTYEFYWNTNADKAFRKIEKTYTHFWTDKRKALAQEHNITPLQTIILASIVDEESNKNDEKPNIASVYLNRLQKGIR